jgi:hypothetical protein
LASSEEPALIEWVAAQGLDRAPGELQHQALGGAYPYHDRTVRVTRCGGICLGLRKINLSKVFAGQCVGIREVDDQVWLVTLMNYDLGFFDRDEARVEPAPIPLPRKKC